MNKLLKSQMDKETTVATREVATAVHKMINKSENFRLEARSVVDELYRVLHATENPFLLFVINTESVLDVIATVVACGYGKLTPLQSIAAKVISSITIDDMEFEEKYHLALELVAGVAQVSEHVRMIHTDGTYYVVSEYKNNGIDAAVLAASHPMPSLIPPKPLVDIHSNAYRSDSGYHVMLGTKLNEHDNPMPLHVANFLGSVAYSIEMVAEGHSFRPPKECKPKNGQRVSGVVAEQIAYNSKLHRAGTCKTMQYLVDEGNQFFFPHSFDKRLRAYSKGYQINLQGDEYDKSVLEFTRKELLTAEGYENLLVCTANAYGLDKLSFTNRIIWCYEHMDELETMANPDEPLVYAKCVRAIRSHQAGEPVGIPTHIDATASGLQINGALMGCRDTLVATNAIGNADDKRMDPYTEMQEFMNQHTVSKGISRKEFKLGAVPAIYGSEAEPKAIFKEDVSIFWKAFEEMHGAYWYLTVLPQLWRDDITEYSFTLDDGYEVFVPVTGDIETEVFVECLGEMMTITREVVGRKEQSKCFLANITHALDAYILRNIVAKCKAQGIDIMCIHDSFGVHPNYLGMVAEWYRIELAALVIANPLPRMLEQIFGVKVVLPNYGHNRTELAAEIRNSTYALS